MKWFKENIELLLLKIKVVFMKIRLCFLLKKHERLLNKRKQQEGLLASMDEVLVDDLCNE